MKKPSDSPPGRDDVRRKLIGLGEKSLRKSYYPELKARLDELERFRALLDRSNDAIILLEAPAMRVVDANEAVCAILGRSRDRLRDEGLEHLIEFDPPHLLRSLGQKTGGERKRRLEGVCRFPAADGVRVPIEFTATLVEFAQRDYLVFVGRDISRRLADEEEKKALQDQLLQARKMEAVGVLAGGIAHDFNNILASILGYSELALDGAREGKPAPDELKQIMVSVDRARELIGQILAFSRKTEPEMKPINLNKMVGDLDSMIRRALPKRISLELDLAPGLRPVNGDPNQLGRVMLNLAANAKDAMPDGGMLSIKTDAITLDRQYTDSRLDLLPGDYVRLSVSDTGQGMDKNTLERIFEPFYTTKEKGEGTGLGLASSFGIVQSHGGRIHCYSEPGRGTVFKIYLPALSRDTVVEETPETPLDSPRGGTETILLADDDPELRGIAARLLEISGYTVITVADGGKALSEFESRKDGIDLVLMDMNMPDMGGGKCLKEILRISPGAKVVMASGYPRDRAAWQRDAPGAAGYIAKPFGKNDLLQKIRQVLDS